MKITKEMGKIIQSSLNKHYTSNLVIDGIIGPITLLAISSINGIESYWSRDRQLVAFIQHIATLENIDSGPVDGLWGPQTEYAYDQLLYKNKTGKVDNWRDIILDMLIVEPKSTIIWPMQDEKSMNAFFGDPGTNQTKASSPYPLKLAWDTKTIITKFSCNEKVKDNIERVLQKVLNHYGIDEIQRLGLDLWGGCLNVRKMRGGTKMSTHSWGTSIDWNPTQNRLKWRKDKASFAKAEYDFWWECWEEEGAISLGRVLGFDWMHIQFAKVK